MGVRLNGLRAASHPMSMNLTLTDAEPVLIEIENGVLHAHFNRSDEKAGLTIESSEATFKQLILGLADPIALINDQKLKLEGDANLLITFRGLMDQFERRFPIVTPRAGT
jgi:alkyl sulfatase BDS1-like metallo-beta-lactamase superfamily hydrolase